MADETPKAEVTREQKIAEYYNAVTREEKSAVIKKYPELAAIFSSGNHE